MPVILRTPEEIETWMTALKLQRPLPHTSVAIVARGEGKDEVRASVRSW
jgi:putative SOS response-associated peptidase YedK